MLIVGAIVSVGDGGITLGLGLGLQTITDLFSSSSWSLRGLPVPKASIKLGNTGEHVKLCSPSSLDCTRRIG